ncbi:glyoxylate reductase/hydroxypyruvate reductase-like isoform X2 [Hermetia illucens]|nr:glyoxylate reductase/hydroxypyruvate reductase-like isoform X2 [Hermetia illucens]
MAEKTFKVVVTHPEVPQAGIDILKKSCEVILCESVPPKRSEILSKIKGVDGILWAGHEPLNGEVLDVAGKNLKAISTMSAGLDYVDLATLKQRKMPLGHTPGVLSEAVADMAIGLMISAARRYHEGRIKIETGAWDVHNLQWLLGQDIRGSTVGFFGFGGIGQAIAQRLRGFGVAKILYTARTEKAEAKDFKAKKVSFDELCEKSDFIFIAAPLTEETRHIFNECAFDKMQQNSVLVNIGRGPIVDQEALYHALKCNKIFAAGLDVMDPEPLPKDHKLLQLPNLILVPHLGSATLRTRSDMAVIAAHNVLRGIAGEPMLAPAYEL